VNEERKTLETLAKRLESEGWSVTPPERYLSDMDDEFLKFWHSVKAYTMISPERGWALAEAVRYICRAGVPGDIAECGVWKGGACLLASFVLAAEEPDSTRKIWLYDTFNGMVSPGENDQIASSGQPLTDRDPEGWWAAGVEEVRATLKKSPLGAESFRFVPGPVEDTLNSNIPETLAILRLDTDWYESTLKELQVLYPRLSSGGLLIIDDYGHFTGARKAVDDYFNGLGEPILLHRSDYTGRVLIKN
jgi:O-methyltransferase